MGLKAYHGKRNFDRTPEPKGDDAPSAGRRFVVQKHHASRLHYDLRLELDGVLKSWAVPKGPSLRPGTRRLAVAVEDHPLAYATFEGVIPQTEYGGGTVLLWDRGQWTDQTPGGAAQGLVRGKVRFTLHGEKLSGEWTLTRTKDNEAHWLLIKRKDAAAQDESQPDVLEQQPRSAKTGRSLEEIAVDADAVWRGREDEDEKQDAVDLKPGALAGARRAKMPSTLRPMLATSAERVPKGGQWLHEIKLDGYRLLCVVRNGNVKLLTRSGHDWTDRFPAIAAAAKQLPVEQAVLDGEAVVLGPKGLSDFQALQNALKGRSPATPMLYAFDLLYLDAFDLRRIPLIDRKQLLARLLETDGATRRSRVRLLSHLHGRGDAVQQKACELGVEGVLSKRADSPYRNNQRSPDWVKVRCLNVGHFAIVGFTAPRNTRSGFGALLLAEATDEGNLQYVGKVGTGFDDLTLAELRDQLAAFEQAQPANRLEGVPPNRAGVHWVQPQLHAEVAFADQTATRQLRHATFRGLVEQREADRSPASADRDNSPAGVHVQVAGVTLSNPDKVFYPQQGLTKRDLAAYYEAVAEWMLPHLAGRPLALLRCPDGVDGDCFFQKNHADELPEGLDRIALRHDEGTKQYVVVRNATGLVNLAQLGALELHPWGARADRPDRPDRLVLDLDPGPEVPWHEVIEAAAAVRQLMQMLELTSFVRTTGGKGLHVVVPLDRRHTWPDVKRFAKGLARVLERAAPDRYTATMSKSRRTGRIYIDYLRNSRSATAIGTLSARARPGATVAMPLTWAQLEASPAPAQLTIRSVPPLLAEQKTDPWAPMLETRQQITQRMRKQVEREA